MDTVSFSTGVLSVIAYATRLKNIVTITIGGRDRPPSLAALLLEYETHIRILEECGRRLLSEIEWTPASAVSGLRLCQQHLEVFEPDTVTMLSLHTAGRGVKILTGKVKEYVREKTKDGMRSFNGAVQLFRKIVKE